MARTATRQRVVVSTIGAWFFGFLIFFPILWMVLASFKPLPQRSGGALLRS